MKIKKDNNFNFHMDTDWIFQGVIDYEQKQYILLDYFQKLNVLFEQMKLYPMFIELSLHLGNIQTLMSDKKILYTNKKFSHKDDELLMSDLLLRDMPVLADEEVEEYNKILKASQSQLQEYFNYAKSIWSIVYESIDISVKKNADNITSKNGVFFYKGETKTYIWEYTIKKVYKVKDQNRTYLKQIHVGNNNEFNVEGTILEYYRNKNLNDEFTLPIFEVRCKNIFPIKETLLPIFKRKIVTYITKGKEIKKLNFKS